MDCHFQLSIWIVELCHKNINFKGQKSKFLMITIPTFTDTKTGHYDFPDSLMVKTLSFHCRRSRFDP